jgi:ADP-heptose:LPS heptosyltransferase
MVQICTAVVAVDSSIKTMASMLRIPMLTLVGDYEEPFRDRHFLHPYVRAGIMKTMHYSRSCSQRGLDGCGATS